MKKFAIIAGALALATQPSTATAGIYADDLTRCLVSSTTPSDRISFVRWMFAAMSAHEAVASLATVTPAERESMTEETTKIFQRLILTDCREQASNAIKYEGGGTLEASFEVVGQVAMGDLMRDPNVAAVFESMQSYMDKDQWETFVRDATGRAQD